MLHGRQARIWMVQIYILLFTIVLNRKPARYYIRNTFKLSFRWKDISRKKCGGKNWTYVSCVYIFICENVTFLFNNCEMPMLHAKLCKSKLFLKIVSGQQTNWLPHHSQHCKGAPLPIQEGLWQNHKWK